MNWKKKIEAPDRSIDSLRCGIRGVRLAYISDYELGLINGQRSFPEHLLRLADAWIAAGNAEQGALLLESGEIVFRNKGSVVLTVPGDWSTAAGENNFGWQLHSLDFLKHLVRLHAESGNLQALDLVEKFVFDWADQNLVDPPASPMSWNDHSTAIRLGVLSQIYIYLVRNSIGSLSLLRLLLLLSVRHQLVLGEDSFYSKGTNHGLDQAFQLYLSALTFPKFDAVGDLEGLALERLRFEVAGSFSEESVHIENSPAYHPVILSSVLQVNSAIRALGGTPPIADLNGFIPPALKFLAYILRPDGCLPAIGDSEIAPVRNNLTWLLGFEGWPELLHAMSCGEEGVDFAAWHAVFPHSGYMVFRGNPAKFSPRERPHIVFKCGFLSRYHRQDDDTSFVLNALGEDWLVDGGLYIHDHGVPEREYMRSAPAHNLLMPVGVSALRKPADGGISSLVDSCLEDENAYVIGRTRMFPGFEVERKLSYAGDLRLEVFDSCIAESPDQGSYLQFWHVPSVHDVDVTESGFTVLSKTGNSMRASFSGDCMVRVSLASAADGAMGIWSPTYGKLEPVTVVCVELSGAGKVVIGASLEIVMA